MCWEDKQAGGSPGNAASPAEAVQDPLSQRLSHDTALGGTGRGREASLGTGEKREMKSQNLSINLPSCQRRLF